MISIAFLWSIIFMPYIPPFEPGVYWISLCVYFAWKLPNFVLWFPLERRWTYWFSDFMIKGQGKTGSLCNKFWQLNLLVITCTKIITEVASKEYIIPNDFRSSGQSQTDSLYSEHCPLYLLPHSLMVTKLVFIPSRVHWISYDLFAW